MPPPPAPVFWKCPVCSHTEETTIDFLIARLRGEGLLKRATAKEVQDRAYLFELARALSGQSSCPACGVGGFLPGAAGGDSASWGDARKCEACGKVIPAERLEVFPATKLCTLCQGRDDRGVGQGNAEYCPHCGDLMEVRQARGSGVTRYAMVCRSCKK